ncbi:hypothetical protein Egran_06377 [Elaphomyces granulatus]|uniref:Uncharacterized protein n=1 Tax=Elaphomyces granulatus TaxID=519963 RepID=A0A232LNX9_9EURO|nr:hypothetical protein Egran_06377 [Elaphomyces granulatus]
MAGKLPPAVRLTTTLFGTHPDCYVKSGLCTLPPTDWWTITDTVSFAALFNSVNSFKAVLEAASEDAEGIWARIFEKHEKNPTTKKDAAKKDEVRKKS